MTYVIAILEFNAPLSWVTAFPEFDLATAYLYLNYLSNNSENEFFINKDLFSKMTKIDKSIVGPVLESLEESKLIEIRGMF